MATLYVTDRNGVEHEVEGRVGLSVMETLRELDYGVEALCGGMCSCATCHVYVDSVWLGRLPQRQADELELLEDLHGLRENSRLACQMQLNDRLDGLRVTIAPEE